MSIIRIKAPEEHKASTVMGLKHVSELPRLFSKLDCSIAKHFWFFRYLLELLTRFSNSSLPEQLWSLYLLLK